MLTQNRLRAVLHYDPSSGIFTWTSGKRKGKAAGTRHDARGFLKVSIDNQRYLLHRLAWLWMTGAMPRWDIVHRNGDHSDNRWSNLNEADRLQHSSERSPARIRTEAEGVWQVGDQFEATIATNTAVLSLGTFASLDEAKTAIQTRLRAARQRQLQAARQAA